MAIEGSLTSRFLIVGAALSLVGLIACAAWESQWSRNDGSGPIYVVFRYDDYGRRSQESVNEAVIDAFRRNEVPVTIAVIPCPADSFAPAGDESCDEPLDPSRVATLVDAYREGVAEIALHGYSHASAGNESFESEFHGVSSAEQRNRIGRGLDEVERRTGVRPSTFVPPFDAYDLATLAALEGLGVKTISGGFGPSSGEDLDFIPNGVYIKSIREAVGHLHENPDPGAVIVSIFHPWDMAEADQMMPITGSMDRPVDAERLDSILGWLRTQSEVRITTMADLSEGGFDVGERRFAMARAHSQSALWRILPPWLKGSHRNFLQSVERYRHQEVDSWLRVSTYSTATVVIFAWLASAALGVLRRGKGPSQALSRAVMVLGALALLTTPWVMGSLGWKDYGVVLAVLGVIFGGALSLLEIRKLKPQLPAA